MPAPSTISHTLGTLRLRPEDETDLHFRFRLFCQSRPPELGLLSADMLEPLLRMQFNAQASSYRAQFPHAHFDIVELAETAIGWIIVDRSRGSIHLVDLAIVPEQRNRGFGTALLRALITEAAQHNMPARLTVAANNYAAIRLYGRLGFVVTDAGPIYVGMTWTHLNPLLGKSE